MNAPHSLNASSPATAMTVVDIFAAGQPAALSVRWPVAGPSTRVIDEATVAQLRRLLEALGQAEKNRLGPEVSAARRALGQRLWDVLDGPERRLTRAFNDTDARGDALDLVIRLQIEDETGPLASHPATTWRWELLSPTSGGHPTADGRMRLVVQMGDIEPSTAPRGLEYGGLRVVFMAYSPQGVQPVLDYEAEEERLLKALERPIRERRARVQVVEEGTLAELERRLRESPADVVHLTGHGEVTFDGPRLILEDELGRPDLVSPEQLLRVLRRAAKRPDLVVISSCHSADGRDGMPSFAAALVAGGMPAVLGWVQPVRDDVATAAAADLYGRLCGGETPAQAVAFVREQLREADRSEKHPSHAWGTLHLLMREARGFRVEPKGTPLPAATMGGEALYRYLGVTGGMRVLERGFIGRRRPLQRLLRILRSGHDENDSLVAGATVLGMKGVGKSCLVGRALDRHMQDYGDTGVVVLHGVLDDVTVVQRFVEVAVKRGDDVAEAILGRNEPVPRRIHRLLTSHWAGEPIVVVLDDFEQNLELRNDGDAVPTTQAAALLEVLLPACQSNRPKLLVTTTASFRMPARYERALAEVALGPLEPPTLRKLWMRMPEVDREKVSPDAWNELGERLGRNARVLEWARTLLRGKAPDEVEALARKAGREIPRWKGEMGPSTEQQSELARLFLRTLAMEETRKQLSEDALTFIERARVYEWPVPKEAFEGLLDGLAIELDRDVTVLQNLGMLEVGEMDGQRAHRVSPLVEPDFVADEAERWHAVAAAFWERASEREGKREWFDRVMKAWEHALRGECEDVAARCGRRINLVMRGRGLYAANQTLAARHLATFPESAEALLWAGKAEERAGNLREGWALYEQGETLALARGITGTALHQMMRDGADILVRLGRYPEAERRLQAVVDAMESSEDQALYANALWSLGRAQQHRGHLPSARKSLEKAIAIHAKVHGTKEHPDVAASLYELARVLQAQGDLAGARARLERALSIDIKVHGTEEHPSVAASLHTLASVLHAQRDFAGARDLLERSLSISIKVHGTEEHPSIAASLHVLARVLHAQRDFAGARALLERSLSISIKVYGTEEHPDVATSLHVLAGVLQVQGDLAGARAHLERTLSIDIKVHGTEEHPSVAASLHELAHVLHAQGDLAGARARLERALSLQAKVYGTEEHPDVATSLHELARVLHAQGDLAGARARHERSLSISIKVHGTEEHPSVATSLHELARVLHAQGDLAGARARLEHSLSIKAKVHGTEEHLSVATSLHVLAGVLHAQGNLAGARARLERSLSIKAKVHGTEEHPSVATSLYALAGVLRAQGDLAGARAHLERSLSINVKVHGTEEPPDVADSLHALAGLLHAEGQLEQAAATYRRVLHIEARIFGTLNQYHSAETEVSLGLLLLEMNQHDEARTLLSHAYAVLGAQVPNHPAMNILRKMFGKAPAVGPSHLARLALQARHSGEAPPAAFSEGLSAMTQAGPPHNAVATILEAIASKRPLPPADASLPEPVAAFVEQVLKVAQQIDSAASATSP